MPRHWSSLQLGGANLAEFAQQQHESQQVTKDDTLLLLQPPRLHELVEVPFKFEQFTGGPDRLHAQIGDRRILVVEQQFKFVGERQRALRLVIVPARALVFLEVTCQLRFIGQPQLQQLRVDAMGQGPRRQFLNRGNAQMSRDRAWQFQNALDRLDDLGLVGGAQLIDQEHAKQGIDAAELRQHGQPFGRDRLRGQVTRFGFERRRLALRFALSAAPAPTSLSA